MPVEGMPQPTVVCTAEAGGEKCHSKGLPVGPCFGPLASLKGSEPWTPILKVVCNGVIMGLL